MDHAITVRDIVGWDIVGAVIVAVILGLLAFLMKDID